MEERRDVELGLHLLDIPTRAASDIDPYWFLVHLASFPPILDLSGHKCKHLVPALQQLVSCGIVD
jgi:hypothetical protein